MSRLTESEIAILRQLIENRNNQTENKPKDFEEKDLDSLKRKRLIRYIKTPEQTIIDINNQGILEIMKLGASIHKPGDFAVNTTRSRRKR